MHETLLYVVLFASTSCTTVESSFPKSNFPIIAVMHLSYPSISSLSMYSSSYLILILIALPTFLLIICRSLAVIRMFINLMPIQSFLAITALPRLCRIVVYALDVHEMICTCRQHLFYSILVDWRRSIFGHAVSYFRPTRFRHRYMNQLVLSPYRQRRLMPWFWDL